MADAKKNIDFVKLHKETPEVFKLLMDTLQSADNILMFNRLSVPREVTWDSRPYVFPPHKVVAVPVDVARHAVTHSECVYVVKSENGEYEQQDWFLVPYGYDSFCIPMDANAEAQILDPIAFMNLDQESQFLPAEGRNGQPAKWRRVSYKPQRPRNGVRPMVASGGIGVSVLAVGGNQ